MNQTNYPQRGEVYFLPFANSHGSEMQSKHPALVVQNNKANHFSGLIIVVPITGTLKVAELPVGVKIMPPEGGLSKPSVIHCGHIYTVDKTCFTNERFSGRVSVEKMLEVNKALKISLELI
jgi:mRNA-degrading endonuclease toxin of MazEF toxin-antitoxin module